MLYPLLAELAMSETWHAFERRSQLTAKTGSLFWRTFQGLSRRFSPRCEGAPYRCHVNHVNECQLLQRSWIPSTDKTVLAWLERFFLNEKFYDTKTQHQGCQKDHGEQVAGTLSRALWSIITNAFSCRSLEIWVVKVCFSYKLALLPIFWVLLLVYLMDIRSHGQMMCEINLWNWIRDFLSLSATLFRHRWSIHICCIFYPT